MLWMGQTASSPQPNPLLQLPVDIILRIALHHLLPPDALCLALTCKDLYTLCFARVRSRFPPNTWRPLENPDRNAFLALLERDVATYLSHCESCAVLHPLTTWSSSTATSPLLFPWTVTHSACRSAAATSPNNQTNLRSTGFAADIATVFRLRTQARLRRRLTLQTLVSGISWPPWPWTSPSPGPQSRQQQQQQQQEQPAGKPLWLVSWHAKVVRGPELLLRCTRRLDYRPTTLRAFGAALEACRYPACRHVSVSEGADALLAVGRHAPCHGDGDAAPARACAECLTDYIVVVSVPRALVEAAPLPDDATPQAPGEAPRCYGWRFEVRTYHRLGGGTAGREGARVGPRVVPGRRDMVRDPAGSIAELWKADGRAGWEVEGGRYREVITEHGRRTWTATMVGRSWGGPFNS
ncbi:hypothetical protein B0T18DRAFT_430864 [Schizothecium vesticola]|uniref:F-box domain-containing protein n=1 Tax=Schizothecium vesticola TaxID=314040 RepID=A0AA40EQH2_9PEZI|nr:hypothetical protein B0T18DRAFT_430864 [Schizothecium vesticola]